MEKIVLDNDELFNPTEVMSLDEFWGMVKRINWPERGYKNLGLSDFEKYWGHIWEERMRNILAGVLRSKSYLENGNPYMWPLISDDSLWDLTSHIVGQGKYVFLSVLEKPELAGMFMDRYKENFGYCFLKDDKTELRDTAEDSKMGDCDTKEALGEVEDAVVEGRGKEEGRGEPDSAVGYIFQDLMRNHKMLNSDKYRTLESLLELYEDSLGKPLRDEISEKMRDIYKYSIYK